MQDDTEVGTGESAVAEAAQGTTETPPAQAAEASGDTSKAPEAAAAEGVDDAGAAPIEYGDFDYSAYPEGFELDEKASTEFKALGQKHSIPAEAMQELLAFDAARMESIGEMLDQSHEANVAKWRSEVEADEEFGGTKLEDTKATAAKAVDAFGGEALRKFFNDTGLGEHPEMVRTFARIGKAISEDSLITGQEPHEQQSAAQRLYGGTMKSR